MDRLCWEEIGFSQSPPELQEVFSPAPVTNGHMKTTAKNVQQRQMEQRCQEILATSKSQFTFKASNF